ncbi:MAG: ribonuclease HII, partial [Oscillospiraceae bacterium]
FLFFQIKEKALYYNIAAASEKEIDEYNILNATYLAMERAVEPIYLKSEIILVDGNKIPPKIQENFQGNINCVLKGDAKSASIAAASILAKVSRDMYMKLIDEKYPQYFFAKHKGYGTKAHYEMLDKYGICEIHRMSFLKKYIAQKSN